MAIPNSAIPHRSSNNLLCLPLCRLSEWDRARAVPLPFLSRRRMQSVAPSGASCMPRPTRCPHPWRKTSKHAAYPGVMLCAAGFYGTVLAAEGGRVP